MMAIFGALVFIFMYFFNYIEISSGMYPRGKNELNMPLDENGLLNFPSDFTGHSEYDIPPGSSMQTQHVIPPSSPNFQQNHPNFYNNELPQIHHETPVSRTISNRQNVPQNYQHNIQRPTRSRLDIHQQIPTSHETSVLGSFSPRQNLHHYHQRDTLQEPIRDKYDLYVQTFGGRTNDPPVLESNDVYAQFARNFPEHMKRFTSSRPDKKD